MIKNPFPHSDLAIHGINAALKGSAILKKGFGTNFTVEKKSGLLNLVTEYDKASEETIISYLHQTFPAHNFLAEESGSYLSSHEDSILWVIDPLDGTLNFTHNIPLFAISIAAIVNREVEFGLIYQPMTNELFVALKNQGAFLNGQQIRVSQASSLNQAVGATGFPYDLNDTRVKAIENFNHFLEIGNPVRIIGSAALNLAYIAAGRFDVFWSANLHPWDVAAGKLLVEEAGGIVTHYNGKKHHVFDDPTTIAANPYLHEEFFKRLKKI